MMNPVIDPLVDPLIDPLIIPVDGGRADAACHEAGGVPSRVPADPQFDASSGTLAARVRDPRFTPGAKHFTGLLAALSAAGDDAATAQAIERALRRSGEAALPAVLAALPASRRPTRGRLTALAGRLAVGARQELAAQWRVLALALLHDTDLKTQLNAIQACGRGKDPESEAALLALLASQPRPEVQRALMRALGTAGGLAAQTALATFADGRAAPSNAATQRLLRKASLILKRELSRDGDGHVRSDLPLAACLIAPDRTAATVWLHCRQGLASLLAEEAVAAGFLGVEVKTDQLVALEHAGPLADLWRLRLFLRLSLPIEAPQGPAEDRLVQALAAPGTRRLLRTFTMGPVRYRLDLPMTGKAVVWDLAMRLGAACPELVNDPTQSVWEIGQRPLGGQLFLELSPKRWVDPRFAYRRGYVPAASHPTLAAALARVAGVRYDDVVWDPFVGSGTELIERARLGPVASLWGTDTSPEALSIAATNAAAAALTCPMQLAQTDCLDWRADLPTLIITNPPMGRRVQRGNLQVLFAALLPKLARQLAPGGRLVWLSPLPEQTVMRLAALGLRLSFQQRVDMGGFAADLQRWDKPAAAATKKS